MYTCYVHRYVVQENTTHAQNRSPHNKQASLNTGMHPLLEYAMLHTKDVYQTMISCMLIVLCKSYASTWLEYAREFTSKSCARTKKLLTMYGTVHGLNQVFVDGAKYCLVG